jgi:hypothetical protein
MKRNILYRSERFDLVSYGHGEAYALHDNAKRVSAFIQGDAATEFQMEWETFERVCPEAPLDDFFAEQIAIRE